MRSKILLILLSLFFVSVAFSQQQDTLRFEFNKTNLKLGVGDTVEVKIRLLDMNGEIVELPFLMFASDMQARRAVEVLPRMATEGQVTAKVIGHRPGSYNLTARTVTVKREERQRAEIPVDVAFPPLAKITFLRPPEKLYVGTTVPFETQVFDAAGLERKGVRLQFSSDDENVAKVDAYGNVTARQPGTFTLKAKVDNIVAATDVTVVENPVRHLELTADAKEVRTGDVIHLSTITKDGLGRIVPDVPITYSFTARPLERLAERPTGQIEPDGRFVAETPGLYTLIAHSGVFSDRLTVRAEAREYDMEIKPVGHGAVLDVYTSDLWVWEGTDGRDYAVTGTWGANGDAYFWDVTDPENMKTIDTVHVDARTVNDVKISEDGRIGVISREGASNRRNGFVVLDVSDPHDVTILSKFDDQLTGGVHNVFIYEDHVYAVNNSIRYDIINIADPENPYRVSRFELGTPGHGVHDVWIENGIAFSSNWQDGVHLVDIGGVTAGHPFRKFGETTSPEISVIQGGGSPSNPVPFASYEYPSGWNHAAFPYYSEDTGKFYVLAGDEAFPYGLRTAFKEPSIAAGWIHFIDFTDPFNPKEVAHYQVPEAGSHNFWVEDDILYAAFYNGGFRVVDISGDLMGDLYRQGREIDWFLPMHREGVIPNAPMVWGPMPHKGTIFLSDMNSGLWAVKLVPKKKERGGT